MVMLSQVNSSDARFDELFGAPGTPAPVPAPAPKPVKEPQALTLLKGLELSRYLKRSSTAKLRGWLQSRVGYQVPEDWDRYHVIAVLGAILEPLTDEQKQRDFDKLLPNALRMAADMADPDGSKAHAAAMARKLAMHKAGKRGAEDAKARRAKAGVAVGSKYSDDEVRIIRWMCANGWKDQQVAEFWCMRTKPAMIWAIRTGVSYKSVQGVALTGPSLTDWEAGLIDHTGRLDR